MMPLRDCGYALQIVEKDSRLWTRMSFNFYIKWDPISELLIKKYSPTVSKNSLLSSTLKLNSLKATMGKLPICDPTVTMRFLHS